MVDTLAPKRTMTQRELDSKLTPIAEKVKEGPLVTGEIVKDYLFKPLPLLQDERIAPRTKPQSQTLASAKEGLVQRPDVKDTGDIETVSAIQPGEVKPTLAERPVMYAATGMVDQKINRPLIVGEQGPEMIIPTGGNKFTVIPTKELKGIMTRLADAPKLSEEDRQKQTENYYDLDRASYLSLDQYLGSAQAFRDAE